MNIADMQADYKKVAHDLEDRLAQGAAFEETVRDSFREDESLMRQFLRHCDLTSLRCSFEKHHGQGFSDSLLNFTNGIKYLRDLTKDPERPYFIASEKAFQVLEGALHGARLMRESGHTASAMLIEERISTEYLPRMRKAEDRNRLRGILIQHEYGL